MGLLEKFIQHIGETHLFHPHDRLLVAVSGGIDSVVLCELCRLAGYHFSIVHCNFQLRGEESERDERFVAELAKRYDVELLSKRFDTAAHARVEKISIQEAARNLRYDWFFQLWRERQKPGDNAVDSVNTNVHRGPVATAASACWVLTAHQADDNAETIAMNFFRGTGLHGLTGIPEKSPMLGYVRRPMLPFSRAEIADFARERQLAFVEDSSNSSSKYTRNYFRNELFPAIEKVYPEVKQNLLDNIARFREIEKLYKTGVEKVIEKICKRKNDEVHIPIKQLLAYNSRALIYEILSPYGFTERQLPEVMRLAESESGRYVVAANENWRVIRHRHWFIVSRTATMMSENIIIERDARLVTFPGGTLELHIDARCEITKEASVALLDAKSIQFPLLLRKWKTGDYFYPLGMKKKKKIARFFIDQKLSRTEKERAWVIEMNKKIVWVVGMRIDDRFKVTDATKEVLRIRFT